MMVSRFFLAIVLCVAAGAQTPGDYFIELQTEPLGLLARNANSKLADVRRAALRDAQSSLRTAIRQRGGEILATLENVVSGFGVQMPEDQAETLRSLPGVKRIYTLPPQEWHLDKAIPRSGIPEAWAMAGGVSRAGIGVKIGILDSGIAPDHPGFLDASLRAPSGYPLASSQENLELTTGKIIVARSYESIYNPTRPDTVRDRFGHGAFVAMCAAGVQHQGAFGLLSGAAPKAWLGIYKVGNDTPNPIAVLKALDDALADGMDIVNVSLGSSLVTANEDSAAVEVIERLTRLGVIVVVSSGNSGPGPQTVGSNGTAPSAITVGSVRNERILGGSVTLEREAAIRAFPGSSPYPVSQTAQLADIATIDPTGQACGELPPESLRDKIALIVNSGCTAERKLNNAQSAGALSVILYQPADGPAFSFFAARATLPGVLITKADGLALRRKLAVRPSSTVTIRFSGVPYPAPSAELSLFSSRGPTYNYQLKPDITAVGQDVYSAAESTNPEGALYSSFGYTVASGTSFASPLVAGAAAVLKSARPGLTVDQYRSLLINTSTPLLVQRGGVEGLQRAGAGVLTLNTAVANTATAYPTSLSFGTGPATVTRQLPLTVTNLSTEAETYSISAIPFDSAPGPAFLSQPAELIGERGLTLVIAPGQSKTIYVRWQLARLEPGEYQGILAIHSERTGIDTLVPYWYGAASGTPTLATGVLTLSPSPRPAPGQTITYLFRVTDIASVAVTKPSDLRFRGTILLGAASIDPPSQSPVYPNLIGIPVKLGPTAGVNRVRFQFGDLPPIERQVETFAP